MASFHQLSIRWLARGLGGPTCSDSFTEVTTKSWGSRLGESIKGVLFGLVLIVGSCVFLFWNEGRAVQTQRSLTEGASLVVPIDPARVDPANDGKLVHVSGDLKPGAPLADPDFAVSASALRLVRIVEMYQWKEETKTETRKNTGGSEETVTTYEYHAGLVGGAHRLQPLQAAGRPRQSADALPRRVLYGARRDAGRVPSGRHVIDMLPANERCRSSLRWPTSCAGRVRGRCMSTTGASISATILSQPRIGDLRVSFRPRRPAPTSIVGRQTGTGFAEYQTKAGDPLLMARPGTHSAADMFAAAQRENRIFTWLLRFGGMFAMFIGFMLILNPLVVVADVVPFIGNILSAGAAIVSLVLTAIVAPVVIALAWFWYRPLVSAVVLAVGLALAYGFKRWASQRVAAKRAAQPVPA